MAKSEKAGKTIVKQQTGEERKAAFESVLSKIEKDFGKGASKGGGENRSKREDA